MGHFVVTTPYPSLHEAADELGLSKAQASTIDRLVDHVLEGPNGRPRRRVGGKGKRAAAKKAAKTKR